MWASSYRLGSPPRATASSAATMPYGRTMSREMKAFLLSVGGLLAVAGSGLLALALWAGCGHGWTEYFPVTNRS